MERETEIQAAARDLHDTIAHRVAQLADDILGRPEFGSAEWKIEHEQQDTPEGQSRLREWHLVKMQIRREAGASQTGEVMNARKCGATWQAIADACGISRQAAFDRWSRFEAA